ncbi:NlpC/P60 family protein [Ignatzschineria ureiclastica]|uniref:NlpC/P60 family protein n=1 Tax=Ignatzschineria ureiclastica TaxID=472582 RepID=A0A2U2AEP5_9GAMM|nr:C40 family peptidase [Ignatzschineria ureiclastica]PWD81136.1 NlpC/P60 family protein [Ignatzschineria ureiclastica]GGZ96527.1 hypothetical protein GCM10007162_10760 [Ignatzschineria ureiclastica]
MTQYSHSNLKAKVTKPMMIVALCLFSALSLSNMAMADHRRNTFSDFSSIKNAAISYAKEQLGTPYLFGGKQPGRGFDCSGLIQYAYQKVGIQIPRDTRSQYQFLPKTATPEPGDLVFFKIRGNRISHAGIYIGDNKMIHAPSSGKRVEITRLDTPYWQKHFYAFGKI